MERNKKKGRDVRKQRDEKVRWMFRKQIGISIFSNLYTITRELGRYLFSEFICSKLTQANYNQYESKKCFCCSTDKYMQKSNKINQDVVALFIYIICD